MERPGHKSRESKLIELRLLYAGKYLDPNGKVHDIWFGFILNYRFGYTIKYSAAKTNVPLGNYNVGQIKRNLITFDHHWVKHWEHCLTDNGQWRYSRACEGRKVQRDYLLKCWLDEEFIDPHPDGNPKLHMGAHLNVIHPPGGVLVDPLEKRLRRAAARECYPNSRILLSSQDIRMGIWSEWGKTALQVIKDFLRGNMAADRAGQAGFDALQADRIEAAFWALGWRVDWRAVRKANKHVRDKYIKFAINSRSWQSHQPIMVDEHQKNSRNVKTIMDKLRKDNPEDHDYDPDEGSSDDEDDPFRLDSESSDSDSDSDSNHSDNEHKARTKFQPRYPRYSGPTISSRNSRWYEGEDDDEFMDADGPGAQPLSSNRFVEYPAISTRRSQTIDSSQVSENDSDSEVHVQEVVPLTRKKKSTKSKEKAHSKKDKKKKKSQKTKKSGRKDGKKGRKHDKKAKTSKASVVILGNEEEDTQSEDDMDDRPAILRDSSCSARSCSPELEPERGRTLRRAYEIESGDSDPEDMMFIGKPPPANPNMSRVKDLYNASNQSGQSSFGTCSYYSISSRSSQQARSPYRPSSNTLNNTPIDHIPCLPAFHTPDASEAALRTINELRESAKRAVRLRTAMQVLLEDSPPPPCKRGSTEIEGEDEERALKKPKVEQGPSFTKIEEGVIIDLTVPVITRKEEEGAILDMTRGSGEIEIIFPSCRRVIEHADKEITDLTEERDIDKGTKKEWTLDVQLANVLHVADLEGSGSSEDPLLLE